MSYWGALVASLAGFAVLAGVQHAAARGWRFLDPRAFIHLGSDLASLASARPPVRAAAPDAVTPPPRAPDAAG